MFFLLPVLNLKAANFSNIKFHIQSGNAEDVTEKLDKGLLDFGILIQPVDLSKYEHLALPEKDIWGVIMRKDSPLAKKKYVKLEDLRNLPLLNSRRIICLNFFNNFSYILHRISFAAANIDIS